MQATHLWKSGSINDVDLPVYTSVVSHTYPYETPRLIRTRLFGGVAQPNSPNAYPPLVTTNIPQRVHVIYAG